MAGVQSKIDDRGSFSANSEPEGGGRERPGHLKRNCFLLGTALRVRAQLLVGCSITLLGVTHLRAGTVTVQNAGDKGAHAFLRPSSPSGAPFTFSNTGSLGTARHVHTATLLASGKVLV